MTRVKRGLKSHFVICINNKNYPASLEVRKIYRVLPDPQSTRLNLVRIVDESGEDYLYPTDYFVPIEIPKKLEESFATA